MYANLKLHIWRSGIHQNRLARELNIDETVLSRIINGYRRPSPQMRSRIAQYLQVDEAWLFRSKTHAPSAKRCVGAGAREER